MTAAPFVLTDATAWLAGLSITGYSSEMSVKVDVDDQDVTTFGSGGYRSRIAGLTSVEAEMKGFWDIGLDTPGFTNLGTVDQVATLTANNTEGGPAWFFQAGNFSWERFGKVGEVDPFTLSLMGTNGVGLVAGQLAKAKGNVSATGALGSAVNVGASTATQYVYVAFHVFTAGTTVTLQPQSDTASNFPSATTQATIDPLTTTGGTWMARLAGPFVGETWWRLNVSAITGTFNVGAAIGIA